MKKISLLTIMLLSAMFAMAQSSITLSFTAVTANGSSCQLDAVKITNITRGWSQTLAYPDINLTLNYTYGVSEFSDNVLSQNRPNPFYGDTETDLVVTESGNALLRLIGFDGKIITERSAYLETGEHHINVTMADAQMAFLHVATANHSYAIKLLNLGRGGTNSIEVNHVVKRVENVTKVGAEPFELGDLMSYTGIVMQNGNMINSNTVTQAQCNSEVITLVFNTLTSQLPIITTSQVSNISSYTASCGGNVVSDGNSIVTSRGVCWSTSPNPTTANYKTVDGGGLGSFISTMTGLVAGVTYYVRAYATNGVGTSYGEERIYTTLGETALPVVTTAQVSRIDFYSALCGGNVTSDGDSDVTAKGVCWSTNPNPTTVNHKTVDGSGLGIFTSILSDLTEGTVYYVRAYATNGNGTSYGEQKTFTTLQYMQGVITAKYSVSETKHVYFSRGNLQYNASTNKYRFAENQLDYIGSDNANISSSYNGWIDLFGWGTGNNPTNVSNTNSSYSSFIDWGTKPISNGGNQANKWRTLTNDEWNFLMFNRTTASGIRFAKATVNGVKGVIILPDDWSMSYYTLSSTNSMDAVYSVNTITLSNWTNMFEAHGAVFLPAAGNRIGTTVGNVNMTGGYWSSSFTGTDIANVLMVNDNNLNVEHIPRCYGISVRLVSAFE